MTLKRCLSRKTAHIGTLDLNKTESALSVSIALFVQLEANGDDTGRNVVPQNAESASTDHNLFKTKAAKTISDPARVPEMEVVDCSLSRHFMNSFAVAVAVLRPQL